MRTPTHALSTESTQAIDLAPMLDFVVNLLVFFIVTAVFVKQAGVSAARPSTAAGGAEKPSIRPTSAASGTSRSRLRGSTPGRPPPSGIETS